MTEQELPDVTIAFSHNHCEKNMQNSRYCAVPDGFLPKNSLENAQDDRKFRITVNSNPVNKRIHDRLTASIVGLRELNVLREKHKKMVEELKHYVTFSTTRDSAVQPPTPPVKCPPSPCPSSSQLSHRSSLSMDSGCLSLASADAQLTAFHYAISSIDAASLPPSRKNSTNGIGGFTEQTPTTNCNDRDDFRTPNSLPQNRSLENSTFSNIRCVGLNHFPSSNIYLTLDQNTGNKSKSNRLNLYRKKWNGSNQQFSPYSSRSKSLYTYPEENTVLVPSGEFAKSTTDFLTIRNQVGRDDCCTPEVFKNDWNGAKDLENAKTKEKSKNDTQTDDGVIYRASKIYIKAASQHHQGRILPKADVVYKPVDKNLMDLPKFSMLTRQYAMRRPRPTSIAVPFYFESTALSETSTNDPEPDNSGMSAIGSSKPLTTDNRITDQIVPSYTWEDVKRLLDPDFESRTLNRHRSASNIASNASTLNRSVQSASPASSRHSSSLLSSLATPTPSKKPVAERMSGRRTWSISSSTVSSQDHTAISRTGSNQSTDSSKSSREKEKSWHESERL